MDGELEVERVDTTGKVLFCSRCGAAPEPGVDLDRRVCDGCGLGVYLSRPATRGDDIGRSFIVVGEDLTVSAVSAAAEDLLGAAAEIVGEPLGSVLSSPLEPGLRRAVRRAAHGVPESVSVPVAARGLRSLRARVLPCGSPRAALVVIEPRLR